MAPNTCMVALAFMMMLGLQVPGWYPLPSCPAPHSSAALSVSPSLPTAPSDNSQDRAWLSLPSTEQSHVQDSRGCGAPASPLLYPYLVLDWQAEPTLLVPMWPVQQPLGVWSPPLLI